MNFTVFANKDEKNLAEKIKKVFFWGKVRVMENCLDVSFGSSSQDYTRNKEKLENINGVRFVIWNYC